MSLIFYSKIGCPWGDEVRDFLLQNHIEFDEREMTQNDSFRKECLDKTGQTKCPTFDIDGHLFPDSDVLALKRFLHKD